MESELRTSDDPVRATCSHLSHWHKSRTPYYEEVVKDFQRGFHNTATALHPYLRVDNAGRITFVTDPAAVIRTVGDKVRDSASSCPAAPSAANNRDMPFKIGYHWTYVPAFGNLLSCPNYSRVMQMAYGGVFVHHRSQESNDESVSGSTTQLLPDILSDVDLMSAFVGWVALRQLDQTNEAAQWLLVAMEKSLKQMMDVFRDEWREWPFSYMPSDNARDCRIFHTLTGVDHLNGCKNSWKNVYSAMSEIKNSAHHLVAHDRKFDYYLHDDPFLDKSMRVYASKAIHDIVRYIPQPLVEVFFGTSVTHAIRLCYDYSSINYPFLLASDTSPVKGLVDPTPIIVPAGCQETEGAPVLAAERLTLLSRHAIPSTRYLGEFLLKNNGGAVVLDANAKLNRVVAQCMVDYSGRSVKDGGGGATVPCPASEIRCVEKHIEAIVAKTAVSECSVCYCEIDTSPKKGFGDVSLYDFFPVHAFMDTADMIFSAGSDRHCSAVLCPKCAIMTMNTAYRKITSGPAKMSDVFTCPSCNEYMVNWLGRATEFSKLCDRHFGGGISPALKHELIKRLETCYVTVELTQGDFLVTMSPEDISMPPDGAGIAIIPVVHTHMRPPYSRLKLAGEHSTRCGRVAMNCAKCFAPTCCNPPDRRNEIEILDAAPPRQPHPTDEELVDQYYIDTEDEEEEADVFGRTNASPNMFVYDDGPGLHKWPKVLSCAFKMTNTTSDIKTCSEAVAYLGRAPRLKRRGWISHACEGKALVELARWCAKADSTEGYAPPSRRLKECLDHLSYVETHMDCFCSKVLEATVGMRQVFNVRMTVRKRLIDIPLVRAFFDTIFPAKSDDTSSTDYTGTPEERVVEYAAVFVRDLLADALLETPECILHRAASFVVTMADDAANLHRLRPDVAAEMSYARLLNAQRQHIAVNAVNESAPTFTPLLRRTVEWIMESSEEKTRVVSCPTCSTRISKNGGCVVMTCQSCNTNFCWLCEMAITAANTEHTVSHHGLLYSTSAVARNAFKTIHGSEVATLCMLDVEDGSQAYVIEDGYDFDVSSKRIVTQ